MVCTLFVISGKVIGLTSAIPCDKLITWCLFGTLGGSVMASLQLMISLFIKSFALPVGISLGGGLSGMVFLAKHFRAYLALFTYGIRNELKRTAGID